MAENLPVASPGNSPALLPLWPTLRPSFRIHIEVSATFLSDPLDEAAQACFINRQRVGSECDEGDFLSWTLLHIKKSRIWSLRGNFSGVIDE